MMVYIERVSEPDTQAGKSLAQKTHEVRIAFDQDQPLGIEAALEKCSGYRPCPGS